MVVNRSYEFNDSTCIKIEKFEQIVKILTEMRKIFNLEIPKFSDETSIQNVGRDRKFKIQIRSNLGV